jgi:hypothetical protein
LKPELRSTAPAELRTSPPKSAAAVLRDLENRRLEEHMTPPTVAYMPVWRSPLTAFAQSRERIERFDHAAEQASVARIEAIARLMDSAVEIPGTGVRLGLDAIIGIFPVVGDLVCQAISAYLIWEARKLGVSRWTLARMVGNTLIDTAIGAVPIAGDVFDVMFRANMKNLALLKKHLAKRGRKMGPVIDAEAVQLD